jgi:general transcription factor 3C polypeptide 5 (transcription factor C subunit 1)
LADDQSKESTNGTHAGNARSANNNYVEASDIYQSLQDNVSRYKVAFVGVVDETHRFRGERSLAQ